MADRSQNFAENADIKDHHVEWAVQFLPGEVTEMESELEARWWAALQERNVLLCRELGTTDWAEVEL